MRSPFNTPLDVRMHQRQASVKSQVMAQPLLLTSMFRQDFNDSSAARNSASSTSSSSSLHRRSSPLKRDSAVSIKHAGSRSDVRRTSMRRSFQSSEAAFVEDDLAKFLAEQPAQTMGHKGPVYRLVRLAARYSFLPPSSDPYRRVIATSPSTTLSLTDHRRCGEKRPLRINGSSRY
jgi:hypothetical protein